MGYGPSDRILKLTTLLFNCQFHYLFLELLGTSFEHLIKLEISVVAT